MGVNVVVFRHLDLRIANKMEASAMREKLIRLTKITVHNFKNVINGELSFENNRKNYNASLLGLYGQNGSGKTALIDVIELLQHALCGRPIPDYFADYINNESSNATITYEFILETMHGILPATYQLTIESILKNAEQNTGQTTDVNRKVAVTHETLKCPILTDKQIKKGKLIDTEIQPVFGPKPKRIMLVGNNKETLTDLLVAKKLANASSRSFIFSVELLKVIRENASREEAHSSELHYYTDIIEALVNYGNHGLFVINTSNSGLISLNAQPFVFKYHEKSLGAIGTMMLPLDAPQVIDKTQKSVVEKIINNMNIVLTQIIPGLTIKVKNLGTEILENGDIGYRIQLMSSRNNREIALKYESEGIKKIVSILQLLIVIYNQPSTTLAVDELDSGVFEYLLGELLRIISEKGKGQLIFTSHNLRPLETLDRGFVAFTTTNPNNRYVRMVNVKDNNNLRDLYYRDIMLGEHNDELYETTNNSEIAFAFREAGEFSGA